MKHHRNRKKKNKRMSDTCGLCLERIDIYDKKIFKHNVCYHESCIALDYREKEKAEEKREAPQEIVLNQTFII